MERKNQTGSLAAVAFFYTRFGVAFLASHRKLPACLSRSYPGCVKYKKFYFTVRKVGFNTSFL